MDRGGRISGTLNLRLTPEGFAPPRNRFALFVHHIAARAGRSRLLRGIEIIFVTVLLAATALYGAIRGGHADAVLESLHDIADILAQHAGFQSANVSIEGAPRLGRADVLRIAGITESSTLFLIDADATRTRLLHNAWIAEAKAGACGAPIFAHARSCIGSSALRCTRFHCRVARLRRFVRKAHQGAIRKPHIDHRYVA